MSPPRHQPIAVLPLIDQIGGAEPVVGGCQRIGRAVAVHTGLFVECVRADARGGEHALDGLSPVVTVGALAGNIVRAAVVIVVLRPVVRDCRRD